MKTKNLHSVIIFVLFRYLIVFPIVITSTSPDYVMNSFFSTGFSVMGLLNFIFFFLPHFFILITVVYFCFEKDVHRYVLILMGGSLVTILTVAALFSVFVLEISYPVLHNFTLALFIALPVSVLLLREVNMSKAM